MIAPINHIQLLSIYDALKVLHYRGAVELKSFVQLIIEFLDKGQEQVLQSSCWNFQTHFDFPSFKVKRAMSIVLYSLRFYIHIYINTQKWH
jgi:hypothetical protein